jgi:Galactose oxidase, central domain
MSTTTEASDNLFLFGGLVGETLRNDTYSFSTRYLSATLLQTTGEPPTPRVGHASALYGNVLVVWGGDTNINPNLVPDELNTAKADNALYLLDLSVSQSSTIIFLLSPSTKKLTREWTRITTIGPTPVGRYGHAAAIIDSKFFVFGGQKADRFLNDLWAFDLASGVYSTFNTGPLLIEPV